MNKKQIFLKVWILISFLILILATSTSLSSATSQQKTLPALQYTLSMPDPSNHFFHIDLHCGGWPEDTIDFKMPRWMPGYYQIMDYGKEVKNFSAEDTERESTAC